MESNERESWSVTSLAFGAVVGAVIAIALQPLIDLLPTRLAEELVTDLSDKLVSFAIPVVFALAAARIKRLDHFLRANIAWIAVIGSVLLAVSIWAHAGWPVSVPAMIAVAATLIASWVFLLACGGAVQLGLSQIVGTQATEYKQRRERDAQRIAGEAIAAGDPDAAVATFANSAAGAFGKGCVAGCLATALVLFQMVVIFGVAALDAHLLFTMSIIWSVVAGVIIAAAGLKLLTMSETFGERYAESVPLEEKYRGIVPDEDPPG